MKQGIKAINAAVDRELKANPARKTAAQKSRAVTLIAHNPGPRNPRGVPGDFSQSSVKVYGRAWNDSEKVIAKKFPDCVQIRLVWKDGEWLQMLYDDEADAIAGLRQIGYDVKKL